MPSTVRNIWSSKIINSRLLAFWHEEFWGGGHPDEGWRKWYHHGDPPLRTCTLPWENRAPKNWQVAFVPWWCRVFPTFLGQRFRWWKGKPWLRGGVDWAPLEGCHVDVASFFFLCLSSSRWGVRGRLWTLSYFWGKPKRRWKNSNQNFQLHPGMLRWNLTIHHKRKRKIIWTKAHHWSSEAC